MVDKMIVSISHYLCVLLLVAYTQQNDDNVQCISETVHNTLAEPEFLMSVFYKLSRSANNGGI